MSSKYISAHNIDALKAYKYKGSLTSFLDRVIMNPFWEFSLGFVPLYIAPNLLTTISLLHAVVTGIAFAYFCPTLSEPIPSLVFFWSTFNLFLYQLLDALDGKQARRTKSSSPLGQLFDHGCDAICGWLSGIFLACSLQCSSSLFSFGVFLIPIVPFYLANWEEANTSHMRFGVIGVTEGQFVIMGILLVSGAVGQDLWSVPVWPVVERRLPFLLPILRYLLSVLPPSSSLPSFLVPERFLLKHLLATSSLTGIFYQLFSSLYIVAAYCVTQRRSLFTAFYPVLQFFVFLSLAFAWVICPASSTFEDHTLLVMYVVGACFSYQISRLIIFHVTDESYIYLFKILIPFPFLVLNEYFPTLGLSYMIAPYFALTGYAVLLTILYAHFVYYTVTEICRGLNIKCFTIVPKVD